MRKKPLLAVAVAILILLYFVMPFAVPAKAVLSLSLTRTAQEARGETKSFTFSLELRNLSPWPITVRPLAWLTRPAGSGMETGKYILQASSTGDCRTLFGTGPVLLGVTMILSPFQTLSCTFTVLASYTVTTMSIKLVTESVTVLYRTTPELDLEASSQ